MFIEIYKKYIYSINKLCIYTISFPYEPTVAMGHSHFHVKVQKARKFGRLKASEKTNQWQKGKAPESCPSKERRGERWTLAWQVTSLNANIQPSPEVYLIFSELLVDVAWSPVFFKFGSCCAMHAPFDPYSKHALIYKDKNTGLFQLRWWPHDCSISIAADS